MQHPKIGKIDPETFESFLLNRLGSEDETVLVKPQMGVDAAVVDIGGGQVLVVAEDPILSVPGLSHDMFGWCAVHIGASDVAVMGVRPRYMCYTLLMPPDTKDSDFRAIVDSIHKEARDLGIAIIGGHTGYYPGFAAPTIGGITVFAVANRDEYITPAGAEPGDDVILTKGPAIEAAGILAMVRESELLLRYPPAAVKKAKSLCRQMTVVRDAAVASEVGVHAMHDATEGGVLGGLYEMAKASDVGMDIDESRFVYPEEVEMVCQAFGIDSAAAISEGSLLISAPPKNAPEILRRMNEAGISASVIGSVLEDRKVRTMRRRDGSITRLSIPDQDPSWPVFFQGLGIEEC